MHVSGSMSKIPDGAFEVLVNGEVVHSKIEHFDGFVDTAAKLNKVFNAIQNAILNAATNANPKLVKVFRDVFDGSFVSSG